MQMVDFVVNDVCVSYSPTPESTVGILDGWVSTLPAELGANTGGYVSLFDDHRATWAINQLGGVEGAGVLELGPLEGGHTYMLDRAGAKSITAIEANKRRYLKCLITKELLSIHSARVLLGNFVTWLEENRQKFDVIWATGVLYYMIEPLRLLRLIADRTDLLHIWTHFIQTIIGHIRFHIRLLQSRIANLRATYSDIICAPIWASRARRPIAAASILVQHGCAARIFCGA
jgi:hypothetical protein